MKTVVEHGYETFGRQHIATAVVAALFSLALHALLFWWLPQTRIGHRLLAPAAPDSERQEPVRLLDIVRERLRTAPETVRPGPDADTPTVEWVRALDELGIEPETAALVGPPSDESWLADAAEKIRPPEAAPAPGTWQPRQEIMAIEQTVVRDEVAAIPRRRIARIERVGDAPDIALPFERGSAGADPAAHGKADEPGVADLVKRAPAARPARTPKTVPAIAAPRIPDATRDKAEAVLREDDRAARAFMPIETMLQARVETFAPFRDREHVYFKIEIERLDDETLPVIPKDIVFVQHSSTRMSETILKFCRAGLSNSVDRLDPRDRFNIVKFHDTADRAFPDWVSPAPAAIAQAHAFIEGVRAEGATDIFSAMESLLALERTPGRPAIAVLVTEGHPTAGITASTEVIGRFTRANAGRFAVYGLGITQTANAYLLDLLSFSNRGEAAFVTRGRWEIPDAMLALTDSIARPVLADVRFVFSDESGAEVYPVQTTHLFKDRPLILYGRAPRKADRLVFQAVGQAENRSCDMIFDLSLRAPDESGGRDLRQAWAEQKIYHLLAEYARRRDPALLRTLTETGRAYRVPVPYQDRIRR